MMNDEKQRKRIVEALNDIVRQKGLTLLYACLAGSRARGIDNDDSDYDIFFVYHHPKDTYLQVSLPSDREPPASTIECKLEDENIELKGWDIYKVLQLLCKSNPSLMEYLFSPMVYTEQYPYIENIRNIARRHYSHETILQHYTHMAHRNYRQYIDNRIIRGEDKVLTKKYLYVIWPTIALLYLEQHKALPPTNFIEALDNIELDDVVRESIVDLIAKKRQGEDMGMDTPNPVLNRFADEHLTRWMQHSPEKDSKTYSFQELDNIVLSILNGGNYQS
jgi:Predicted nucleotidyltransferase